MRKAIFLDGGVGRIICSIPAVEAYIKQSKDEVVIITGWLEPYLSNKLPVRVYHINQAYLWEDIIRNSELIHPEPYWDYEYYNQKTHLIQSFYKGLGLKIPKEIERPNIHLQSQEIEWARNLLNDFKKQRGHDKVVVFQPYGASAIAVPLDSNMSCGQMDINKTRIIDDSNRSLSRPLSKKIEEELSKEASVLVMSHLVPLTFGGMNNNPMQHAGIRQWMALIHEADYVVGIDSCAQHLTYAFKKPGFFVYGGTYPENLSYKEHKIFKKPEFPQEYNPIRLPANPMQAIPSYNEGAMDFTEDEETKLINSLKEFIQKPIIK